MRQISFLLFKPFEVTQNYIYDLLQRSIMSIILLFMVDLMAFLLDAISYRTHANCLIWRNRSLSSIFLI
ncbi:hypothetical protein HZ326_29180 [Fusarium oxysporum f. sp. albedinis]|nr:hypothetical protein HZ326_29180 [Fusarium oxysporum f. sp. albedinis]